MTDIKFAANYFLNGYEQIKRELEIKYALNPNPETLHDLRHHELSKIFAEQILKNDDLINKT